MIKINKTLGLALLTALAASCSSDNDVAQSNNPTIEKGESAFATLRINLPTQQGSRAATFEDGLASEYKVNDATLLVFKKENDKDAEGAYKFVQSVNLGNMNPWYPDETSTESEITTQATVTAELDKIDYKDLEANNNIYGLVILNNGPETAQKITLPQVGTTFSDWNKNVNNVNATNMQVTSNGIVMANAPEWTTAGAVPTTLVQIKKDMVKPTAAQAEAAGPAADIYVERGLAKVTMEAVPVQSPTGSGYTNDKVGIFAWALDVTNLKSFPVHMVEGLNTSYTDIWKEQGTGENQIEASTVHGASINRFHDVSGIGDFKRVYWGMDPNYNRDPETGDFKKVTDGNELKTGFKDNNGENPQYCLENTFDIDHMKQNQTTRVLFGAIYKLNGAADAATFYKIGDQSGLYTKDALETLINTIVKNVTGKEVGKNYTLDLGEIATVAGSHPLTDANFKAVTSGKAKAFTRVGTDAQDGTGTTTLNDALTETEIKNVNAQLNGQIKTYLNGVCYYIGRIKHFGNDETPWNQGDPTYNSDNLSWLGRYGVLRNNWYSLKVNSIYGPGEPVIPDTPDTPDDDKNYIDLSVKVLKWAKRSQTLHF